MRHTTPWILMVRTSTSVRRTSTIMKSAAGAFVATNSCSPSVDMLGGCERGCGNDRAHAGVGFSSLSIQLKTKRKQIHIMMPMQVIYSDLHVKFVKFAESHWSIGNCPFFQLPPPPCTYPFSF